ncbi:hypothetical protein HpDR91_02790 [Helicobacter pylori]
MKFFKIPKLHLNSRECQEMFLSNVKFSKKTQQFYFKNYPDVNVEIFRKVVEDRFYSTLFGGAFVSIFVCSITASIKLIIVPFSLVFMVCGK